MTPSSAPAAPDAIAERAMDAKKLLMKEFICYWMADELVWNDDIFALLAQASATRLADEARRTRVDIAGIVDLLEGLRRDRHGDAVREVGRTRLDR